MILTYNLIYKVVGLYVCLYVRIFISSSGNFRPKLGILISWDHEENIAWLKLWVCTPISIPDEGGCYSLENKRDRRKAVRQKLFVLKREL